MNWRLKFTILSIRESLKLVLMGWWFCLHRRNLLRWEGTKYGKKTMGYCNEDVGEGQSAIVGLTLIARSKV
jgi:hypothetical protein